MKTRRFLSSALFLAPALLVAAMAAQGDRRDEFRTKFRAAMEIQDRDEMAKLVRLYQREVVDLVVELCEAIPDGTNENLEKEIAALSIAWRTSQKTGFVDAVYKYFSQLDQAGSKERRRIANAYNAAFGKYHSALAAKDGPGLDKLCVEFESQAADFELAGDLFHAARAWSMAALCVDEPARGKAGANLERVVQDYGRCVAACNKLELADQWFQEVKARWDGLRRIVNPGGDAGSPGAGLASVPVASGTALIFGAQFEAIPSLEAFERPNYHCDEVYVIWPSVYLKEKGSNGTFLALGKLPKVLRIGSSQLQLDLDGDDKGDQVFPLIGNKTLVQFAIGEGGEKRQWACLTEVGTNKDSFQGLQVNLAPDETQCNIYVFNAASVVGTLSGTKLRVLDDNMDGKYGSPWQGWNFQGLLPDSTQPEMDSVVVGDGKRARPWSEYLEIGGAWYQMETALAGLELRATPVTLETGKLKLAYKGEAPAYVVVQGKDKLEKSFYDLLQNGGAEVSVPVGDYKLSFGIVRKGKKAQTMKALMLPGPKTQGWSVSAGKTTTVQLGAPFGFGYDYRHEGEKVTVVGASVVVMGSAGERYERTWNCAPKPEAAWRKAGTKKASKGEKMPVVMDLNEMDERGVRKYDWGMTWHPLDVILDVKLKTGEISEVQLAEKKNKLFGEIESAWQ